MNRRAAAILVAMSALAVGACSDGHRQRVNPAAQQIAIDGSSTVFPLAEAASEAFTRNAIGAARVTVGESGTGGGFRKLCRGEIEVANASRPISAGEMQLCAQNGVAFVEVLIAFDGVTVVTHPSNAVAGMTMAELRQMWRPGAEGEVNNWRQINGSWPDLALQLFGPGTASGTFDFFTEAVMGEGGASRTDYTPSEDDNVIVQGVSRNAGALGYFGYAYYDQNRTRVKAIAIDGVMPSPDSIASGEYPLSRPMFVYFNAEDLRRPQVLRFALYYIENAAALAPAVGYVAMPAQAYETYARRVREREVGTAFGGENEVALSIEDMMSRPLVETPH